MRALLVLALASVGFALTWLGPAGPFAPFVGVTTPTYEWTTQWQSENPAVWGKNYTIVPSPDGFGCQVPPPGYAVGKIVTGITPPNDMCWPWQMAQYAQQGGAVAVLLTSPFPQMFGMYHTVGGAPAPGLPPVVNWGNINPQLPVGSQVPLSLVVYDAFAAYGSVNVTLDFPSQNPLYTAYNTIPSQFSFVQWWGYVLAMCSITFVSAKLFVDIQFSGIRIALPLIVLSFCYVGSVIVVLLSLGAFVAGVPSFPGHIHALGFLILFPYTCTTSACVLIGFYFTEVSHLTSQKQISLLDTLKIPGYISIASIWVIYFVVSGVGTFYRSGNPTDLGSKGPGYAIAVTYGIVALLAMFIACFGGFKLIKSLPPGQGRGNIISTVVLVVVAAFLNLGFLPCMITIRWWLFEGFAIVCTEVQLMMLFGIFWVWPPAIIYCLIASVFRVSLSREIEISKSATSSTSGSYKSSSSSSSNSSAADPVIEL